MKNSSERKRYKTNPNFDAYLLYSYIQMKRNASDKRSRDKADKLIYEYLNNYIMYVRLIEFSVYVIQGVMSALVGVVLTSKLLTCTSTIGNGMEVNAIAAVVIGGASMSGGEGSVVGTIVGALILTIISNAMNLMSVNAYLQQVVMGLIIIMAILFDMVRKGYIFRKPDEE